ncbi:amino acid ABC transporter substrate-binding protein [Alphaproteobacteria bacterium]|nr:amino acid ABC transporter substrate-binding protein [Alphaproteobacteria bacterium]
MNRKICTILSGIMLFLLGCEDKKSSDIIKFGLSADYPPFEYYENGELKGFDVELGRIVAQEMGKKAEFEDMGFNAALVALNVDSIQAVISTVTSTPERRKNYDLSRCYYTESLAIVYNINEPYKTATALSKDVKVACQLGTTMEFWVKKHATDANLITMDKYPDMIEALKADQIDCVVMDTVQAKGFCAKNPGLGYSVIEQTDAEGYAIAFKKNSPLKDGANAAISKLEKNGWLAKLKAKYQL